MDHNQQEPGQGGGPDGMMAMMVMMMAMCFGVVLLFAVIPSVGVPLGLLIAVGAGALMLFLHNRYMNRGRGH